MRKRPTFEEVARIVNADSYKIDLPQRTYIRWEDTVARTQFDQFREAMQEGELQRLRRQVAQAMPAPTARAARRAGPVPTPGQTTLTGEVLSAPEESEEVRRQRARFTVDNVASLPSGSNDKRDPDAGSAAAASSATTVPPSYLPRPGNGGGGGSSGGPGASSGVTAHEMQTLVRQLDQSNSVAHGKLQEALAHHTVAHAQTVQKQIEALATGLAHESQRADARDAMSREIARSLEAVSRNQIATLPSSSSTPTQQNLDRMRTESVAAASAASASQARQETLIGQIGNALGGVMQHVHGQNETIQDVMKAINSEPRQTVLNQYGTQYVDKRAVLQDNRSVQQNVLNQDNRSLSIEQKILNLFHSGGQSGSSSSSSGGPGGGGGGGPPKRPKSAPEQFFIGDEPKQEKRAALAIEDRPKKQKPSQPDAPIALPDRTRQAKRKPEIPKEAPDVKKLAKTLVRAIRKNNEKIRVAQPTKVVDVGPATPFKGKGRRLGDEERVITTQFDKKATAADIKRRARNNQLAIAA